MFSLFKKKEKPIEIPKNVPKSEEMFIRVQNTLKSNNIIVKVTQEGVLVRMAGDVEKGEAFTTEWGNVYPFKK